MLFNAAKLLPAKNFIINSLLKVPSLNHSQLRFKTYRRSLTKLQRKYEVEKRYRKAAGLPPLKSNQSPPKLETRLYKVENGMKIYKPVTPGLRNRKHPTRFHLWKGPAVRRLSFGKRSTGGRNCHGRVTTRHRGGGHKKRIRCVDFYRSTPGEYQVNLNQWLFCI
jgi:hypothetical protein